MKYHFVTSPWGIHRRFSLLPKFKLQPIPRPYALLGATHGILNRLESEGQLRVGKQ
jgi:hypothetical protein